VREAATPSREDAGLVDAARAMTDNFGESTTRRSIALEARHVEALRETLDRLRLEIAELRASRERLVVAADAERRRIERDLHEGVQQQLVALAVNVQLVGRLTDDDPPAMRALLEEMGRDVQQALDEAAQLANRIYPTLLETGGLAAALRTAVVSAGIPASVEVRAAASYPPEIARTVYFCCLEALEHAAGDARATVTVRDEEGGLAFDVVADGARPDTALGALHERVEALGGRLTISAGPAEGTHVSGWLPLPG
jgi:signal transduction histidine kinase